MLSQSTERQALGYDLEGDVRDCNGERRHARFGYYLRS